MVCRLHLKKGSLLCALLPRGVARSPTLHKCMHVHTVLIPWKQGLLIWFPPASQWLHQCLAHRVHNYNSVITGRMNTVLSSTLPSLLLIKSKSRRQELEQTPRGITGFAITLHGYRSHHKLVFPETVSSQSLVLSLSPREPTAYHTPWTPALAWHMGTWNSVQPAPPPTCPHHCPSQKTACHPWPSPLPGTPVPSSPSHPSSDIPLSSLGTPSSYLSDPSTPWPSPPTVSSPWTEWPF